MTEQPKTPNFYPINFEKLKVEHCVYKKNITFEVYDYKP